MLKSYLKCRKSSFALALFNSPQNMPAFICEKSVATMIGMLIVSKGGNNMEQKARGAYVMRNKEVTYKHLTVGQKIEGVKGQQPATCRSGGLR